MYIFVEPNGKILGSDSALREGLNVLGKLHGVMTPDFELKPVSSLEELQNVSPARIDAAGPLFFVRNGKLVWAAPDITATRDLFYAKTPEGNWVFTDDFFRIARAFSSLHFPRDLFVYFFRHGFLPPGSTFFEEIMRLRVGTRLIFEEPNFQEENVWQEHESAARTYETFKRAFSSVFEAYPFGDQAAISLSAGADSGLVAALAAVRYGKHPLAITIVNPNQSLQINDIDAANVGRITKHLGLEHTILEADFNAQRAEKLREVAHAMPLAAHLSLEHFQIGEEAHRRGKIQLWQGQSADSAYNLGPTQKSWGGPLRRFYLTKEYWQGFPDVSGNRFVGKFARILGQLGPIAWKRMHAEALRQPTSFQELVNAFENAQGTPPFPAKGKESMPGFSTKRTTREAREEFFAWKAQAFLTGRDPRIRYTVANHYGFEAVLPYTASNMLGFFRGLEMDFRDVFSPKRFIYQYLEELLGKKAYAELYKGQERRVQNASPLTWAQWQEDVLSNTVFGRELREAAIAGGLLRRFEVEDIWNRSDLQHVLGPVWVQYVFEEIEGLGVSVEVS
ncbi:hypothetical protein KKI17_00330 [Patescibacteria group bacterium]|nr:hypothetical protein [Patescibacteria group bacterium]